MKARNFEPEAKGWVVRRTYKYAGKPEHASWWYGADHGFGTTSGPLDYCVAMFRTKREGFEAIAALYGVPLPVGTKVERVVDAVAFELERLAESRARVLEGDRQDKQQIADACERSIAYLRGERASRR